MIDAVIDLSHHNPTPDFGAAHAGGLRGVIHKATQGLANTDSRYAERVRPIRDAGLMHGAYHFGTNASGVLQARHFLDVVKPDERTLLALDWEENPSGGTMTLAQARDFANAIYFHCKRYPLLYSGNLAKEVMGHSFDPTLSRCPLWLAQYGSRPVFPVNWRNWALWQYTDHGAIERNSGKADRSRFNGDENGLRKLWGYPPLH